VNAEDGGALGRGEQQHQRHRARDGDAPVDTHHLAGRAVRTEVAVPNLSTVAHAELAKVEAPEDGPASVLPQEGWRPPARRHERLLRSQTTT
jgi:hypothetical protein